MTDSFDVIVVGAGPAGATAAYHLARAGVKVALVDKQTFPRDKVCGDGAVSPILVRLEKMGLADWLEGHGFNAPQELLLSAPNGQAVRFKPNDQPGICYGRVIPRLQLDEAVMRRAVEAGAALLEGVKLNGVNRPNAGHIQLLGTLNGRQSPVNLQSRMLITADGVHASFTRQLGLVKGEPDLVALRAYYENVEGGDGLLEFHYDAALTPGYAWIFPMTGGRANVGLGTIVARSRARDVNLRERLDAFIQSNRYAAARLGRATLVGPVRGYPLRSRMTSVTPIDDNVLVAGEAAGLVNPLNGEGIGTAMFSGELAAKHAQAALAAGVFTRAQLRGYATDLEKNIGRNHAIFRFLQKLVGWPWVMNRIVQRAGHDREFAQILFEVIVELKPPRQLLSAGFTARWLAG
jgi:geranylgeranyl reductase family protein